MLYGYDFNQGFETVTKLTGSDRSKARDGARRASVKHGMAAMLFFRPGETEPCGAVTYVDGLMSSREGITLASAA